jgi:hypothetical protein
MSALSTYYSFGTVFTLNVYNNLLYVGGYNLRNYDGNALSTSVCILSNNTSKIYNSTLYQNKLLLTGSFTNVGFCVISNIAMKYATVFDGTTPTPVATNDVNNTVFASAVYNNKLYIGGDFTNVSGSQTDNIASINGLVATENTAENAYSIKVLDNPNNTGIFKIQADLPSEIYPIRTEISDITGRVIAKNKFSDNNIEIAIENKTAGFYVLTIFDKNNQRIGTQKLVISK